MLSARRPLFIPGSARNVGVPSLSLDGGFSRNTVAGMHAWWRSTDLITIATGVSNWGDLSGSGFPVAQATPGKQPVRTLNQINGHPTLVFTSGNSSHLFRNDALGLTGTDDKFTCFIVYKRAVPVAADEALWSLGTAAASKPFLNTRFDSGERYEVVKRDGEVVLTQRIVSSNASVVDANAAIRIDQTAGTHPNVILNMWKNGGSILANTGTDFDVGTMSALDRFAIGALISNGPAGQFFNGGIAEIILYSRELTVAEKQVVVNYMGPRYAITTTAVAA